jgi:hypothetical protein
MLILWRYLNIVAVVSVRMNTSHTIQIDKPYFEDEKKYTRYNDNAYGSIGLRYIKYSANSMPYTL